jgi:diguanylate cyclase (GGDEF)-like protein/PAS domain S-box-containing protein/putative nucleotidyltransferase with HDIG domain
MKDINKTKKQLVDELANLRRCISEMEVAAVAGGRVAQGGIEDDMRLMAFIENALDAVFVHDVNGKLLNVNRKAEELCGYSREEVIGKSVFDLGVLPHGSESWIEALLRSMGEGIIGGPYEFQLNRKDGGSVSVEAYAFPVIRDWGMDIVGIAKDITERKRAEEALRSSEEKLRIMFRSMNDGVVVSDLNVNIIDVNKAALEMSGYRTEEDIKGLNALEIIKFKDQEKVFANMSRMFQEQDLQEKVEYCIVLPTGKEMEVEVSTSAMYNDAGSPVGFINVIRDVTERKAAAESLRASEEKLRLMFESIEDGIFVVDLQRNMSEVNEAIMRMTGYSRQELLQGTMLDYVVPEYRDLTIQEISKAVTEGRTRGKVEFPITVAGGRTIEVEVSAASLRDAKGNPIGLIGVVRDITERRRADKSLRESEERYRLLAENVSDVIWTMNMNLEFTYISPSVIRMIKGYTLEELKTITMQELLTPEALATAAKVAQEELALEGTGKADPYRSRMSEVELRNKDGSTLWAEVKASAIRDQNGKAVGFLGVVRDITERRRADKSLRESEERYRLLAENVSDVIWIMDLDFRYLYVSPSIERTRGFTPDEAMRMPISDQVAPESLEVAARMLSKELELDRIGGADPHRISTLEVKEKKKDGSWMWAELKVSFVHDGEGKPVGILGVTRDITERKKAEETLRSSEEKYRDLVEREKDVICAVDTLGFITSINSAVSTWGYTPEQLAGTNFLDLIAPEWREITAIELQGRLIEAGEYVGETVVIDKNGERCPIEYSATVIMVDGGYAGARAIVRDIAERKRAEEKIERQARRFKALHAVAQVISQSMNLDKMLNGALAKACEAMDIESGCIFLLDFADKALGLDAYKGVPEQIARRLSTVMLTDVGLNILLDMKEPVTVLDEAIGVTDFDLIRKVAAEIGARSIAAVPFFRGMDVRGVLVIFATNERVFSKDDLELLTSIANEIAVGADNIKLLERTQKMSVTDELTGLYNRRHFFAMLDAEMNRAQRSGRPFSLVMLDLDGFKEYNDKFGHTNGDTILQVLAKILGASIRKSDMAFRYGGDEFAILIPAADAQKALKIVERARAKWQKAPGEQSLVFESHIGFSTGIAEFPANAESADGLVFLADAALYQAKRHGGFKDKLVSDLKTLSPEILDVATQDQVYALAATVDARDPYTYGHSKRVAGIAVKIARRIGMADDEVAKLHAAALLHDIGKVGVPDAILTKVGQPTPEEWDVVKRHCTEGARIVGYVKELASIVPVILHHHEWYNGTGYPDGLKGTDIPLGARITSVADAYDTMITQRPYRHVVAVEEACRELRRYAGTQFDPELVGVWCKLVEESEKGK